MADDGSPIASARIMFTVFGAGTGQTTFSDSDGRFVVYELQPRIYNVNVSAAGFIEGTQSVDLAAGFQMTRIVLPRANVSKTGSPAVLSALDLAVPEKARNYYQEGLKELDQKKFDKSVEQFKKAIKEYPRYAAAHSNLGIAYLQIRKSDLARDAFTRALELDKNSAEATLGMGLLLNDEKRYRDAEEYLLRAGKVNPGDWHVHYELGRAYYGLNLLEKAEEHLHRARQDRPTYGNLYLTLANVLVLQNKLAEGLAEMEEFLKVAPGNALAPQVREKVKLLRAELKQP